MHDFTRSLSELVGKKIKDIEGYISDAFDDPFFKLERIIFEDGSFLWPEGEHDYPYVYDHPKGDFPALSDDNLIALLEQEEAEAK